MIPKQAIEKAIEGGWRLAPYYKGKPLTQEDIERIADYFVDRNNTGALKNWQEIALDPTFWQALGKALGWPNGELTDIGLLPGWHHEAIAFCHLILTGGNTDKFWEEVLKD